MSSAADTDQIIVDVKGVDNLSKPAKAAAASLDNLGQHADVAGVKIEAAQVKVKTFGENLAGIKPPGEALSAILGVLAVGAGTVAGTFAAAAGASDALKSQLDSLGTASQGTLKVLGDTISVSKSWMAAVDSMNDGLSSLKGMIEENRMVIDDLTRDSLSALTKGAIAATYVVAGLAESLVLLNEMAGPYLNMIKATGKASPFGMVPTAIYRGAEAAYDSGGAPFAAVGGAIGGALEGFGDLYDAMGDVSDGLERAERPISAMASAADRIAEALARVGAGRSDGRGTVLDDGMGLPVGTNSVLDSGGGVRRVGGGRARAAASGRDAPLSAGRQVSDWYGFDSVPMDDTSTRADSFMGPEISMMQQAQRERELQKIREDAIRKTVAAEEQLLQKDQARTDMLYSSSLSLGTSLLQAGTAALYAQTGFAAFADTAFQAVGGAAQGVGSSLISSGNAYGIAAGIGLTIAGTLLESKGQEDARERMERDRADVKTRVGTSVGNPMMVRIVADDTKTEITVNNLNVGGSVLSGSQTGAVVDAALRRARRAGRL